MPEEPQIKILPRHHRTWFFWALTLVFLLSLPLFIFYTTGYRLSFENEETTIFTTGGMYVTTEDLDVDVYVDEVQVERPRLFRSAYYVQNIEAGLHRVVVQRPDLQTWVKILPVDAHIVVEASAFNMPVIPHVRPITQYTTTAGTPVFLSTASTTELFVKATSTMPFVATSTVLAESFSASQEYVFVASLFSTSSVQKKSVFDNMLDGVFRFATTTPTVEVATSTKSLVTSGNMQLIDREGELFALWGGDMDSVPHYFCVPDASSSSTAIRYGEHVAEAIVYYSESTTTPLMIEEDRYCRREIKIDRKRQDVYFYDFLPNSSDLVVIQLEDGLYATEIDDRAWQNIQLLYPGIDLEVVVENNVIYIKEDDRYFELVTEIEL